MALEQGGSAATALLAGIHLMTDPQHGDVEREAAAMPTLGSVAAAMASAPVRAARVEPDPAAEALGLGWARTSSQASSQMTVEPAGFVAADRLQIGHWHRRQSAPRSRPAGSPGRAIRLRMPLLVIVRKSESKAKGTDGDVGHPNKLFQCKSMMHRSRTAAARRFLEWAQEPGPDIAPNRRGERRQAVPVELSTRPRLMARTRSGP